MTSRAGLTTFAVAGLPFAVAACLAPSLVVRLGAAGWAVWIAGLAGLHEYYRED